MKSAAELNRLLLEFLLLCQVDVQESSWESNAKFNLGRAQGPGEFQRAYMIQNFGNHGATSGYSGFITNLLFWPTRTLERMDCSRMMAVMGGGVGGGGGVEFRWDQHFLQ